MACYQEIVVRALDMKGNLIAELDEIGLGPGEIKGVGNMFYHPYTKEIELLDWGQNKFNYFDYDLNYLRSIPKELKFPQFKYDFIDRDFSIEQEFENRDGKFLFIITANINLPDSVKEISNIEIDIINYDFASELRGAAGDDRIYIGKTLTDKIEIDIFDLEGNILNTFSHDYPKIMKTEEELEQLKETLAQGSRNYKNYKHFRALEQIMIDAKNCIWVTNHNEIKNCNVTVFSQDGELLRNIDLETPRCLIKIREDKLYKLIWDEDDTFNLEIYKIEG